MSIKKKIITKEFILKAFLDSIIKFNPIVQLKNPVMFIVYIGAIITIVILIKDLIINKSLNYFNLHIAFWLIATVLFANLSDAIAEGHGKAKTESLKKTKKETPAKKLIKGKKIVIVNSKDLKKGDIVVCEAGDIIPSDGEIIEGIASIDESAITGESAPVIRESGGDKSSVTMGTRVLSDRIVIKIMAEQGNTFIDKMISLIESSIRQKTPNEIALTILLASFSIIFLLSVVTIYNFTSYTITQNNVKENIITTPILISLLVCLIPTTIGGLLNAIGISGIVRLMKKNVLVSSGRAIEASGDVDVMLLDKTGTITYGNRMASELIPAPNINLSDFIQATYLSSVPDETPEGKSIINYIKTYHKHEEIPKNISKINNIPFSAQTRSSGVDITYKDGQVSKIRKGSSDAMKNFIKQNKGNFPTEIDHRVEVIAKKGGTPLVVCKDNLVLGVIHLKDTIKSDIKQRFETLRKMGIKTIMVTGDNPLTAASIAIEAGVDDFIAEFTPEAKLAKIREEQEDGHLVAMIGDGTNDAPALAQSDVAVAMNTGTQTAKEAGNMIDLDNDPTKLIDIVETGKQLLITRGSLTTFSIANDISKYFAILPAIFSNLYVINNKSIFEALNIMKLATPQSAILSAVIFNAIIIVMLIPLALRGVKYKPDKANKILRKNLLIYGLGGIIMPFIGIKLIDMLLILLRIF